MVLANARTSRRDFLRGGQQTPSRIRPVGAGDEPTFRDACTQCGDCAKACPERIIRRDGAGFPYIDFSRGGCTFCGACTLACGTEALNADMPWSYRPTLAQSCLALNGVTCRTCQDFCEQNAIRFQLRPGGLAEPRIDADDCIGCGDCVSACPLQAISLDPISTQTEVRQC